MLSIMHGGEGGGGESSFGLVWWFGRSLFATGEWGGREVAHAVDMPTMFHCCTCSLSEPGARVKGEARERAHWLIGANRVRVILIADILQRGVRAEVSRNLAPLG